MDDGAWEGKGVGPVGFRLGPLGRSDGAMICADEGVT